MHVFLETERLYLRRFTVDDAALLHALDNDTDVMHFINNGQPVPMQEIVEEDLPVFLGYHERLPGFGFWAAIVKSTGAFIGWFHYRPAEGHEDADPELGYRLHTAAWGLGYAAEGSRALIDHGFTELGVQRVVAETMAVHTASRRVMEKVGMTLVRTFHADWPVRIPGDEHGDVEYAITREQWMELRGRSATTMST